MINYCTSFHPQKQATIITPGVDQNSKPIPNSCPFPNIPSHLQNLWLQQITMDPQILNPKITVTATLQKQGGSSIRTQLPDQIFLRNGKPLFTSCSSSGTVEFKHSFITETTQAENEAWTRYLLSEQKDDAMLQLTQCYLEIVQHQNVDHYSIKQQQESRAKAYRHFVEKWLRSMGYGQPSNRKYVLSKLSLMLPGELMPVAARLYDSLLKGLAEEENRVFVERVCKNGWECFIFAVALQLKGKK